MQEGEGFADFRPEPTSLEGWPTRVDEFGIVIVLLVAARMSAACSAQLRARSSSHLVSAEFASLRRLVSSR